MGSLVVKLDKPTVDKIDGMNRYSDIDMFKLHYYQSDLPMSYGVDAVRQSIKNILMWRVGESIIHPEFGHNIHRSSYEQLDQFSKEKVCQEIKRALEENDTRIDVVSVSVDDRYQESDNGILRVKVVYAVNGSSGKEQITQFETIQGK